MFRSWSKFLAPLIIVGGGIGCDVFPDSPPPDQLLDGPIDGLTPAQLSIFVRGDEEFGRRFTAENGLGPLFVATSCNTCHPGDGDGHPVFNITRFGRTTDAGFDGMMAFGGPQLQNRAIPGYVPETVPTAVTGTTRLTAPSITGLGFLEAVDDATILTLADPDDEDGDGISGRPQLIDSTDFIAEIVSLEALVAEDVSGRTRFIPIDGKFIGRFGKKGVSVNLLQQAVTAYSLDMGLTTDLIPLDLFNVQVGNFATDDTPDPEVSSNVVNNVVFYLKTLRPPPRRNAAASDVMAGEQLFQSIRCATCHTPTLRTGISEIPQLSEVEFHPYTDLLLHDMGPELDDGYTEGIATTAEWRTAPLWGLGLTEQFQGGRPYYLHDGRARSLQEAIDYHGGEAAASRAAFQALSQEEQDQLFAFLKSL
jgi:CxxC motif-containing protein (DUF1111 family)